MYCPSCGHEIAANAGFCSKCGSVVFADPTPVQTPTPPPPPIYNGQPYQSWQPFYRQPYPIPPKPSAGWLVFNIVLTVFSGFTNIFAIVGIVLGALGQSAYNHGDYKDAESKTKACKVLAIVSLVLFLLLLIACFIATIFMSVFSAPSTHYYSNL